MLAIRRLAGLARRAAVLLAPVLLAACGAAERIADIGKPPSMSPIENPAVGRAYQPVAMPMPRPVPVTFQANSLWRPGARAFFKDQRAAQIGDILTVNITIEDEARIANETQRVRESEETSDLTNLLGYEGSLGRILPEAVNPASLVSLGSDSTARGRGTTNRKESVKLTVAAVVTQSLPNGNLVITGRQEVRVNFEMRILTITGVVRPEDITADNTVRHTQIAEARISYGGRGQLTDVQQPRYGQQLFDIVFPF